LTTFADLAGRPTWRFVVSHPAHFVAFGFGSGLAPTAPGTVGTLVAVPLFWIVAPHLTTAQFVLVIVGLFGVGVWACDATSKALGVADYSGIVWDEIVAFLLVLAFTPRHLAWQGAAYVCFRFFDIAKPPPVGIVDRRVKGGIGVMLDDLVAAFYALPVMVVGQAILQ